LRPPIGYAYLVSTSYSGTTLLSLLLDSHPAIVSVGELDNTIGDAIKAGRYAEYPCSCGAPIRACSFFRSVEQHCARQGVELDVHEFRLRLGHGMRRNVKRFLFGLPARLLWLAQIRNAFLDQFPQYRRYVDHVFERNIAIARAAIEVSGKDVFLDASKAVARVPYLHRRPEIDLRVIHIVRDVRAIVWSSWQRGLTHTDRVARSWARVHANALRLAPLIGKDRYFCFRWEDFCTKPGEWLDHICRFLGVESTGLIARANLQAHHVIGNRMRLNPVGLIRPQDNWRQEITSEQLAVCERVAGGLSRRFGYH
jgi:hypothetical protein